MRLVKQILLLIILNIFNEIFCLEKINNVSQNQIKIEQFKNQIEQSSNTLDSRLKLYEDCLRRKELITLDYYYCYLKNASDSCGEISKIYEEISKFSVEDKLKNKYLYYSILYMKTSSELLRKSIDLLNIRIKNFKSTNYVSFPHQIQ